MSALAGLFGAHARHLIAAGFALGLALARLDPIALFTLGALIVLLLTACQLRAHVALAAAALLLVGSGVGSVRLAAIDADPMAALSGRGPVTLRGHLVGLPRSDQYGTRLRLRVIGMHQLLHVTIPTRPNLSSQGRQVAEVRPNLSAQVGQVVEVRGRVVAVDPAAASSDQARSFAEYLLRNGVRRRMTATSMEMTAQRRGGAYGVVDAIRSRAERALAHGLPAEPAALLRGMVLGGDAALSEATAENFRIAGLAHILAVSGQNVLLIVILVLAILTACGASRTFRLLVPAAAIVIYMLLCGAQASVIRAGAMGLAALAALAASRPSSRSYGLILAVIAVLLTNPRASADVGAQLSFAAVLGIIAFTGPVSARLTRPPRWAADAFAATLGATLATAPLMAYHFGAVSLVSLAANVLGEPLIAPIVWLGSLTATVGQLSLPLAALLGGVNQFLLAALIELARVAASVPGAQLTTDGFGVFGLIVGLLVLLVAAGAVNGVLRLPPARTLIPAAAIVLLAVSFPLPGTGARAPAGPAVVMLDVGQGDATLLIGRNCNALIDGGPPGAELAEQLDELGVERLDAMLITHAEDDHFGGALELVRDWKLPVATLIDGGGATPRSDYAELRRRLAERGTRVVPAVAGTKWSCPELSIDVIGPEPLAPGEGEPVNPNERAAVTQVTVGQMRLLASGDAESPQLTALPLAPVDLLKVAHHGSGDPGLGRLLERTRPRLALIGVGGHNRYGHPAPDVLGALAAAGVAVARTDRGGTIFVRQDPGGALRVKRGR